MLKVPKRNITVNEIPTSEAQDAAVSFCSAFGDRTSSDWHISVSLAVFPGICNLYDAAYFDSCLSYLSLTFPGLHLSIGLIQDIWPRIGEPCAWDGVMDILIPARDLFHMACPFISLLAYLSRT